MLLSANDPALRPLKKKNWRVSFDQALPDLQQLAERAYGVPQISAIKASVALESLTLFQTGSQMALGGIVQSIGIPTLRIFNDVVKTFDMEPGRDILEVLEGAYGRLDRALSSMQSSTDGGDALEIAASAGISTGIQAVSAIPIAGFAARLAWSIGKLGMRLASLAQSSYGAAERIYPPSRFDPETDVRILNGTLLDQVRTTPDWTNVFSPPTLGTNVGTLPPYARKETESGYEIFRVSGYDDTGAPIDWASEGWLGMVPGTATLHSGISISSGEVSEIGSTLFPTARGVASWLWKQVTSPDALSALFTVHADDVINRWQAYIHELHEYVDELDFLNTDEKKRIMTHFNADGDGRIFNWGTSIAPVENEWDHYQPTRVGDRLRARQFAACDTLLIAYVDESFGAFRDEALLTRFRQRRAQLLDHPAVCDVQLGDVVDAQYADALRDAGAGTGQCMQIRPWFKAPGVDDFDGTDGVGDTGEGGEGGLGGLGGGSPRRSSGSGLLKGALGVAALYGLSRLLKR